MAIILDLCAGTGAWSHFYKDAGYDVHYVELSEGQDVRLYEYAGEEIQGVLAAPPCDHLAVSGARWWKSKGPEALLEALSIADACMRIVNVCHPEWWVLENPVGRLRRFYGPPKLIFDPCDYGDPYTKKTLLWGTFQVPVKTPVEPIKVCSQGSWIQKLGGKSAKTKRLRSATPQGFAKAFFEANP